MTAATKFQKAMAGRGKAGSAYKRRYSAKLKALALEHLAAVRAQGGSLVAAARQLGVDGNSLRAWEKETARPVGHAEGKLQAVRVVADAQAARFVVFGPAEVRIECEDARAVAELLRALR